MSERQPKAVANDTEQTTTPCEAPTPLHSSLFTLTSPVMALSPPYLIRRRTTRRGDLRSPVKFLLTLKTGEHSSPLRYDI